MTVCLWQLAGLQELDEFLLVEDPNSECLGLGHLGGTRTVADDDCRRPRRHRSRRLPPTADDGGFCFLTAETAQSARDDDGLADQRLGQLRAHGGTELDAACSKPLDHRPVVFRPEVPDQARGDHTSDALDGRELLL